MRTLLAICGAALGLLAWQLWPPSDLPRNGRQSPQRLEPELVETNAGSGREPLATSDDSRGPRASAEAILSFVEDVRGFGEDFGQEIVRLQSVAEETGDPYDIALMLKQLVHQYETEEMVKALLRGDYRIGTPQEALGGAWSKTATFMIDGVTTRATIIVPMSSITNTTIEQVRAEYYRTKRFAMEESSRVFNAMPLEKRREAFETKAAFEQQQADAMSEARKKGLSGEALSEAMKRASASRPEPWPFPRGEFTMDLEKFTLGVPHRIL